MNNVFIQEENKYPIGGWLPINVPAVLKGVGQKLRDRMYRTVKPEGYSQDNALNFIQGNPRMYSDPNTEGLWGMYTGQDSVIANSSQAPDGLPMGRPLTVSEGVSLGFSPNEFPAYDLAKYAVKDIVVPSKSREGAYELAYPNKTGNVLHLPLSANDVPEDSWQHSHQLGTFHQTRTTDGNGTTVTYEDTYDINPFRGVSSSDDPSWSGFIDFGKRVGLDKAGDIMPFGRPFEVYGSQDYDSKGRPVQKKDEGGFLFRPQSAWEALSQKEKADVMKVAVRRGITDLATIRQMYNEFAEGGYITASEQADESNLYKGGGYTSSDSIRSRIAKYEGKAMTGAIDPLSGKWDKNRSFEAEDASFYDALPESIRGKVLSNPDLADNLYSYSYNVGAGNFKKRVVPTLEKYYQGKATVGDIEKSMWASGDAKLRGLRRRRAEERAGVRKALDPTVPIVEQPVSTYVPNPYALQQQNTIQLPQYVPSETEYVRTVEISPEQQRARQLQERFDQINMFNQIMKLAGIENTAIPVFMPTPSIPLFEGLPEDQYAKGGRIHIKPSHRGRLTELKKRTGKSASWFKAHGTPAQKKMATFELNSRHWNKHAFGGYLEGEVYNVSEKEVKRLIDLGYEIEYL